MEHKRNFLPLLLVGGLWLLLCVACWIHPSTDYSVSERRPLQQRPALNGSSLISGQFMEQFETYTLDQFPARDSFRSLKAVTAYYVFQMSDNNGVYFKDGYVSKLEYPLNETSVLRAAQKLEELALLCQDASRFYLCIVPDKNYYLADSCPHLDYDRMYTLIRENLPWTTPIDLCPVLELEDYYRTDTHWRQECLPDVAAHLATVMQIPYRNDFTAETLDIPFYGVYRAQAALPLPAEDIILLHNNTIDSATVYNVETGTTGGIYDLTKADSSDAYEVYLSGAAAVLQIDNPTVSNGRKLIVFRDSFAGPLIPLLLQGYETVTMLDTRYISPAQAVEFIDAADADVLFLYSTILLNNAASLR